MSVVVDNDRAVLRVVVGLVLIVPALFCTDVATSNHRSFNLRAMSGEGKRVSACLSRHPGCAWTGWRSVSTLRAMCPDVACVPESGRYAYSRVEGTPQVLALAVMTYEPLAGDLWLAAPNEEPLHCVDRTHVIGLISEFVEDLPVVVQQRASGDPRCRALPPLPEPALLRRTLTPASSPAPPDTAPAPSTAPTASPPG